MFVIGQLQNAEGFIKALAESNRMAICSLDYPGLNDETPLSCGRTCVIPVP